MDEWNIEGRRDAGRKNEVGEQNSARFHKSYAL